MQRVITLEKKDFSIFSVLKDMSEMLCEYNFVDGVVHTSPYSYATAQELRRLEEKIRHVVFCMQTIKLNAEWKIRPVVRYKFETCCNAVEEVWTVICTFASESEPRVPHSEIFRIRTSLQKLIDSVRKTISELDMRDLTEEYIQDTVDTKIRVDKLTNQFNKEMRQYLAERGFFGQMKKLCSRIFKTKRGDNG